MALKKVNTKPTATAQGTSRLDEIDAEIAENRKVIAEQEERIKSLLEEALNIKIAPFKLGDYAMVDVRSGRQSKVQKCLLEGENGILYVRPIKNDGELSGRRFSITPVNKSYAELLKPVEE